MSLFEAAERRRIEANQPLPVRMRPRSLDEFIGQEHFLGEGKLLRRMIQARRVTSVIFYGPPGTGKTTLSQIIAHQVDAHFVELNAADCGIKEVRAVLEEARDRLAAEGVKTLLFLDEIHHFNRTQQDILLPDVENGGVVLIGATTQNPFFSINAPLVSRSQIFHFESLSPEHIATLLRRAVGDKDHGFGDRKIDLRDDAIEHWASYCDGDARRALTALEIAVLSLPAKGPIVIDRQVAADSIQRKALVHDGAGDEHYDLASAYIKSMRGSDPDAAIYWLARMLEVGEEPRFLARRLMIFASEDVGLADPHALPIAAATLQAVEFVGLPEAKLNLAHATLYMATAPKSGSATRALDEASKDVREGRTVAVPEHLRDSHYAGAGRLGHGKGYRSPHDDPAGARDHSYLPVLVRYYHPIIHGAEAAIAARLKAGEPDDQRGANSDAKS